MSIGAIFKITDLLARGVPWQPILKIFLLGLPYAVSFAIPVSALTASLLLFGRLSSDNEITAMKACGVSMRQIAMRPAAASLLLAMLCLYINNELAPRSRFAQRHAMSELGVASPLELLEEGRFIQEFDGMTIYIGQRRGTELTNIRIYDLRKPGVRREIRAHGGTVLTNTVKDLSVRLHQVRIDPFRDDRPGAMYAEHWLLNIPNPLADVKYYKKSSDLPFVELVKAIANVTSIYPQLTGDDLIIQQSRLRVDLHRRIVMALATFTFVLLGIPLGTRSHRKESSIGIAMSLVLVAIFYLFIILAESLAKQPRYRPEWITWIPILLSGGLGLRLIHRAD